MTKDEEFGLKGFPHFLYSSAIQSEYLLLAPVLAKDSDECFGQWCAWVCSLNVGDLSLMAQGLAGQKWHQGPNMLNISKYSSLLGD